jgi:hypothetical protein
MITIDFSPMSGVLTEIVSSRTFCLLIRTVCAAWINWRNRDACGKPAFSRLFQENWGMVNQHVRPVARSAAASDGEVKDGQEQAVRGAF